MTPLVWANFPLAAVFILAFAGVPLWMTFKYPPAAPDHSGARAYLAAKAAAAGGQAPQPPAPEAQLIAEAELIAEAAAIGELIAEAVLAELARRARQAAIATRPIERPRCWPAEPAR